MIENHDKPPYETDSSVLQRFDERNHIFGRVINDKTAPFYYQSNYINAHKIVDAGKEGYSRIELARSLAGWTVYNHFAGAFSDEKLRNQITDMSEPKFDQYKIENVEELTLKLKETAQNYGACLTGVCELNPLWVYTNDMFGKPIEIPGKFKYAIVMAIKMDKDAMLKSPRWETATESAICYSKMAFTASCLAEFIRNLGYNAISSGNDTALSIPMAIDAGLGELGRNGLLITPEFGPGVRLCKVFTDMPLVVDKPIRFGVNERCLECRNCANACDVDAVSFVRESSYNLKTKSNNPGTKKWTVDHDKCYMFWLENGGGCSSCLAACPYFTNS